MRIRIFRCSHPGMLCRWKTICSTTFRRDYCTVLQHRSCIGSSKTWEELVDQAAADGGVQFDATSIYYDLGFVRACGGYIFKYQDGAYDTADIGLDNEGSVEAYAFINDLCNKYKLITADVTADIARSNFQNGKCAYYIGGPWDIDGFTSAGTKFAVAKMPTFHGQPFVTPVGTQVSL